MPSRYTPSYYPSYPSYSSSHYPNPAGSSSSSNTHKRAHPSSQPATNKRQRQSTGYYSTSYQSPQQQFPPPPPPVRPRPKNAHFLIDRIFSLPRSNRNGTHQTLGYAQRGIRVIYTNSPDDAERIWKHHLHPETAPKVYTTTQWLHRTTGFDTEFVNDDVAVVVCALQTGVVLLYQNGKTGDFPPTIRRYLDSPEVIKAAANVNCDVTKLKKRGIRHLRGFLPLDRLIQIYEEDVNGRTFTSTSPMFSLKEATTHHLGMTYRADTHSGEWDRAPLDGDQLLYTAMDGFASLEITNAITDELELHPAAKARAQAAIRQYMLDMDL
ncbi:hypothetical protein HDV00_012102 [Rhizophlyctis rosea]|nr:hypothetical protein HDV00_012102 [Rhizophlyctis rosea]